jgi:hypothetical protein
MAEFKSKYAELYKELVNLNIITSFHENEWDDLIVLIEKFENFKKECELANEKDFSCQAGKTLSAICWKVKQAFDERKIVFKKENKDSFFCFAFRGGLCNRLRVICAVDALSSLLNKKYSWCWSENKDCLGALALYTDTLESAQVTLSSMLKDLLHVQPSLKNIITDPVGAWNIYDMYIENKEQISFNVFNAIYIEKQRNILNTFTSHLNIKNALDTILLTQLSDEFLGVHIRRTDMVAHWNKAFPNKKFPDLDDYKAKILSLINKEDKFFISCDDVATKAYMVREFSDQVCFYEGDFIEDEFRQTTFAHTLADLYLLSSSSQIISTQGSSFSDFAVSVSQATAMPPPLIDIN